MADAAPKVTAFYNAHPDIAAEQDKVKALPKEQGAAELKTFRNQHAAEYKQLAAASAAITKYQKSCAATKKTHPPATPAPTR